MKASYLTVTAVAAAFLAGCASDAPTVYGPAPEPAAAASGVLKDGYIAECSHRGAPPANVIYPAGWQERLAEVAEKSRANDELLGGPVTTEIVDRDAKPVQPPVPDYPAGPASRGLEAQCYAMMDVTPAGVPEDILTACSSPEFNAATLDAAADMRFRPRTVDGRNVRRLNVVYPVTYCLQTG